MTRVVRLPDAADVAEVMAERLLRTIVSLQASQGHVNLCLTGGRTANAMYERLAALAADSVLDSTRLNLWWGDDNFIPAANEQRNSLQAISRLAAGITLASANIHMMPAQEGRADAAQAASEYAAELGDTHFDITLMGVGEDGHTAALFPNHPSSEPTTKTVIGVSNAPKPPEDRLSLTEVALNRSSQVWFIATGPAKAVAVEQALAPESKIPAGRITGEDVTYWFVDEAAARELPTPWRCTM